MADCLLEAYRAASIENVFFILRDGKWDIPAFYADGHRRGLNLAYLITRYPHGTPFTLDQAYPFIHDKNVALGFPDIQFKPMDVYQRLLHRLAEDSTDIVLGLFPTPSPFKVDMVDYSDSGRVREIVIKPARTHLHYGWFCAVWTPAFTRFMHDFLANALTEFNLEAHPEIYVGTVMQAALAEGMEMAVETSPDGEAIDVGTPEDLERIPKTRPHES